jgi:hypothetical protein
MLASNINIKGFFESDPIYRLHAEILDEAGTSWDDLAPLHQSWLSSPVAVRYIERMVSVVEEEFGDGQLIVIKDPRLCRLVPFWREVLKVLDIEPCFVLPIRDPLEVASSLKQAQDVPELKGLLLWLQYFLQAERDSRGAPRAFLTYDNLLSDWRAVINKLSGDLDLSFPRLSHRAAAEADEFLTGAMRHHTRRADEYAEREDVVAWVKETYAWAQRASKTKPASFRRLDQIWTAYCVAEVAFGPVVAHSQLERDRRKQEAQHLLSEVTELKLEIGELQGQLVPREQVDQLQDQALTKEKQIADLVECIKLMLAWIANSTPAGQAAHQRLDSLLGALDTADGVSISELASNGLKQFQRSEVLRLQEENDARASREEELSAKLCQAEQRIEELNSEGSALRDKWGDRATEVSSLQEQLSSKSLQLEEWREQLEARKGQIQTLRDQVASQHKQLVAAEEFASVQVSTLETQEEQLQVLRDQVASQHQQLVAAEKLVSEQESTLENLQSEGAQKGAQLSSYVQQLDAQHEVNKVQKEQLQGLRDQVASQHGQLTVAEELASAQASTLEALRTASDEKVEQLARLESEAESLRAKVAESDSRQRDVDQRCEQLDLELLQLRSLLEVKKTELRTEINEASRRQAASARSLALLSVETADLHSALNERKGEVEHLREENSVAFGEIQRLHGVATNAQRWATEYNDAVSQQAPEVSPPPASPQPAVSPESGADTKR